MTDLYNPLSIAFANMRPMKQALLLAPILALAGCVATSPHTPTSESDASASLAAGNVQAVARPPAGGPYDPASVVLYLDGSGSDSSCSLHVQAFHRPDLHAHQIGFTLEVFARDEVNPRALGGREYDMPLDRAVAVEGGTVTSFMSRDLDVPCNQAEVYLRMDYCGISGPCPRYVVGQSHIGAKLVIGHSDRRNVSAGGRTGAVSGRSDEALSAAQQACLEEKVAAARESQQKRRGLGRLMGAVSRTAARFGGESVARAARDLYDANATADDLAAAARDLGVTESDIEACRNP